MSSIDKYLVQALDNYPYNLEDALTSLEYALSYNENNTQALCLYGRFLAEQFKQYEEAKSYFQKAIQNDLHALEVYPYYIDTLLKNEDFYEAERLIRFALTVKGIDKFEIKSREVLLYEMQGNYKQALALAKQLPLFVYDQEYKTVIEESIERLKSKKELVASTRKSKK